MYHTTSVSTKMAQVASILAVDRDFKGSSPTVEICFSFIVSLSLVRVVQSQVKCHESQLGSGLGLVQSLETC